MGMEFTNNNSKGVLLPLELNFSNLSDPNVVIEPPDNNWRSDNRQIYRLPSLDVFPGGISLEININPRRGGDVDCPLYLPLLGLLLQAKEAESQNDPNILTRKGEEDMHLLVLLHYLLISPMIMADTKEVDIVHWLHRIRVCYSLRK